MKLLEALFGVRKPKSFLETTPSTTTGIKRAAPRFTDIDPESDYSKESIQCAQRDCVANERVELERKLRQLSVVDVKEAERLLLELHQGEDHHRAPSLSAAVCFAATRTRYNSGNFAELVHKAEVQSRPICYLMALHSWKQDFDAFGTKASYFVRVDEDTWLCAGQTRFGS